MEPTPGLEPGTPSLRGKESVSSRVRPRAVEVNKVLHVVRIAEDFWGQARPWMVTAHVLLENLIAYAGKAVLYTLTPPGADVLPL